MPRSVGLLLLVATTTLSGCGDNTEGAAEASLREWLEAVHDRDAAACDLMTTEYRRALAAPARGARADDCLLVVEQARSAASDVLPPADAELDVAAWDPSGEALVEATGGEQVRGFWMQYLDGRWLIAGVAS